MSEHTNLPKHQEWMEEPRKGKQFLSRYLYKENTC
jgi:hypothetical protein